jgi:murein biosynthesis integral membrane protein MurJ
MMGEQLSFCSSYRNGTCCLFLMPSSSYGVALKMSQSLTQTAKMASIRVKTANKHIFRALLSLSSAALFVRMIGMLNQVVASTHFGAGAVMDAYFVAYTLPTVVALLIVGAIEAAVIPVYSRVRSQESKEQASRLFSTILNLFMLGSLLLTILLIVFHRQMVLLTAPALDPFRANAAANLALFMDPVLFLMVVVGLLECVFNVEGQFGWPAYAGILVPLTTAILVVFMGNSQGVVVLCIGTVLGLCLQLGVFIIRAKRAQLVYRPVLDLRTPEMSSIFIAIWPVFLSGLIGQASPLVDQIFASLLSIGSISALSYSLKIVSVFSGVVFASVGRAALPFLSRQAAANDMKAFKATLRLYLWAVGLGTAVLSVLMLLLAHPIVQILFQRGAFTAGDTNRTATTFIGFVFGLTPMALGFVGARAFSAIGKNRVLLGVSAFSVVANAVFDYIFARFWQSQGIALSTSAVYFCTMFILFITLSRMIGKLNLLMPPTELLEIVNKIKFSLFAISPRLFQLIGRLGIAIAVFAVGIIGNLLNTAYTLRIALGSIVIIALLRYRYALLIAWVLLGAFIGSTLPFFNGNHLDTALTVPTLLSMIVILVGNVFKRMPALIFLLLYLVWVFASIGISTIGIGSFLTLWLTYLNYLAVALLVIQLLSTPRRLYRIVDIMILVATFVALYGIYGYITKHNGVYDPTTSSFRIFSIYSAAPPLALFFSIFIPLAIYRAFMLQGFKRVVVSLSVLFLLIATILTFSRGAFISISLSIVVFILFLPSSKMKLASLSSIGTLILSIIVLSRVLNIPIFGRFLNQDFTTLNGRTYLWQVLFRHFDPVQLLGNGLDASRVLLTNLHVGFSGGLIANAPSNLFVGTLYDHGIIGLSLLILIFATLFITLIRGIFKTRGEKRMLFVVALSILVSAIIQSFEVDDLWIQEIGLYFWMIMAFPFALCWSRQEDLSDDIAHIGVERTIGDVSERVTIPQMESISL